MNIRTVENYGDLFRASRNSARNSECSSDQSSLEARLYGTREDYINMSSDEIFKKHLAEIWDMIVKPVFDVLNLKASWQY
jgi:hypothetical protein